MEEESINTKPIDLSFNDVCVDVNGNKILAGVSGRCPSGQMLAVMGPSGSGKTTLLNILAGRLQPSKGHVLLNNDPLDKQLRRKICYVLQTDTFLNGLTVRETLDYYAELRIAEKLPRKEKLDEIIDMLELKKCLDITLGDTMHKGLSGGERKRVNIACELLMDPALMLLDEPTTGLDSSTAFSIMKSLKDYAEKEGKTVIVTVHQPSSQIFYLFDKLLLLCNGQTAYYGESNKVVDFFASIGIMIKGNYNPADFMMEEIKKSVKDQRKIISACKALRDNEKYDTHSNSTVESYSSTVSVGTKETLVLDDINSSNILTTMSPPHRDPALWDGLSGVTESTHYKRWADTTTPLDMRSFIDPSKSNSSVCTKIDNDRDSGRNTWSEGQSSPSQSTDSLDTEEKWPTSFYTQLHVLTKRNFIESRKKILSRLNWGQAIILSIIAGLLWFNVPNKESHLTDIQGWMFFSISYWMLFTVFGTLNAFPAEREVIHKERSSGMYRLSAYYIAKMIGELPLALTLPSLFHIISFLLFVPPNVQTFFVLWVVIVLCTLASQSLGIFFGATFKSIDMGTTIAGVFAMCTMLFGGFYITNIPYFMTWLKYLSIVHYALGIMKHAYFSLGVQILCDPISSNFEVCRNGASFIPYEDLIKDSTGSSPLSVWVNSFILFSIFVCFRYAGYLILRYRNRPA